jgi:hypothetical protein
MQGETEPVADEEATIAVCSTLVAGPGVFICSDCVAICGQVIEHNKPASVPRVAPWELESSLEGVLTNLPRIAAAGAQVDQNLVEWVRRARSLGATWTRVGEALGVTRQSAWERFSGEE